MRSMEEDIQEPKPYQQFYDLLALPADQLEVVLKQRAEARNAQYRVLMETCRLRQINTCMNMKRKYPDNAAIQKLCDKEIARLTAEETTGA